MANAFKRPRLRAGAALLPITIAALFPVAAQAQESAPADSEAPAAETAAADLSADIVVTARRQEERLQDVPVSVTALGEKALQYLQAADLGGLEGAVPNLSLHVGDASNAVVYIRGVGQIDSLAFADPGVGIYVDDVYLGRAQGAFLDVYDVARIEVLRGPQGTLYGRNTIGGAVKFISKQLTNDFAGEAEASYGSYDRLDLKASINVPLINDELLAKVAIARSRRDGFSKNLVDGSDDGDKDLWAGRLALEYRPSSAVSFRLNADMSRDDPNTSRTPARATSVFGIVPPNEDPFEIEADFNGRNRLKTKGVSLVARWEPSDSVELKSITAYREMDYATQLDLDGTRFAFFGVYVDEAQNQFSQELQLNYRKDRISAVGGLFYFQEHDGTLSGLYGPAIDLVTGSFNDQHNKSYAAYGQVNYALTDKLTATGGLRYTFEKKKFKRTQKFFAAATPFPFDYDTTPGLLVTDINADEKWGSLSPKVGLDYKPSDDLLLYASASRGFKSGGFDGRANTSEGAVPYEPETLWAYEVGAKSSLLDRRLTANLSLFQNDYKDLQLSSFVADEAGGFAALFTNAAKARIRGAEFELNARPVPALGINAMLSYLDARYLEFIGPGGVDISDDRKLVNAPRWQARLGANYRVILGRVGSLTLGGDISYRSKTHTVVSSSEILAQPNYALVDALARFEAPGERWWLSLGVKNLTDKRYITHGFDLSDSLGYQLAYYGEPRTVRAAVGFRF